MRAIVLGMCVLLLLAGCQSMLDGSKRASRNIADNYVKVSNKMSGWFKVDRTPPPEPPAMPPRYCYQLQADVVCYDRPVAGKEARLVGSQGTGAGIYEGGTAFEANAGMAPIVVKETMPQG